MAEWKEYIFEQVIEKFIDYRGKTPTKSLLGIPLITAKIVKNGRLQEATEFISEVDYIPWMTRGFPEINDVVLTTEAPLGEVALIKEKRVALAQRIITLQTKKKICDSVFLKYYLQSEEGQSLLQARASGSTVEGIKAAELKKLVIRLPSLSEQKAIASILSSLDDKIDLLHRQIATLEKMAETLFRQWFVEEAKEEWKDGKLGDVLELLYGKALKDEIRTGNGYPVIGSSGIVGYHSEFLVQAPGIVIGRKGTLGKVNYLFDNFYPIDTTYFVKTKVNSEGLFFEYFLLKNMNFVEMNSDSAVPGLNRDIAYSSEILIPPSELIHKFNSTCNPFFKKLRFNNNQILLLTNLRDTLLPKLMSGEVKISVSYE